jgi:cell wall-associated NlpC family hydrolase
MAKADDENNDKANADSKYDPYSDARDLYRQEQDAADQVDDSDQSGGGTQQNADTPNTQNIDKTKEREQEDLYTPSSPKEGGGKKNKKKNQPGAYVMLAKKTPMNIIIALLLGGFGGVSLLFSPGAIIVDLKEKMVDKFDDQLAAMDVRTTAMIKKKFKGTTKGVCTKVVNIRCKFNSMSDKQLKKLEKAGIKVNTTGDKTLIRGRAKIDSFEFNGKTIKASEFASELRTNTAFRSAMFKGYNPKLAGFADSRFMKLAQKLGISKQKNVTGDTDDERRKSVVDSANGDKVAEQTAGVHSEEESCDGGDDCKDGKRTVYKDENGNTIDKAKYDARISESSSLNSEFKARKSLSETGSKVAKGTLKGALTVTALGLGAVDSACTGYQLIRTVGFAAKYLGMLQLLRYAQVFMNTADSIKAGDATPEQVEYVGKILTTPNSEGKGATDSYGYKYAVYGDINGMPRPEDTKAESVSDDGNKVELSEAEKQKILINDETTKYINGQLVSKNILTDIVALTESIGAGTADALDDACDFVKSGWGQAIIIGAAVVGAVVAFFTGGASLGWGTVAQVTVSIAISVAMAMLTPKLIDMAAGTVIGNDELTNGNRTGNAITSGMGGYNAQTAQGRGLAALKVEDAPAYMALTDDTQAQYAALDRYEKSPFDTSSPNTFLGALVSKFIPYSTGFSSFTGTLSSITNMAATSFSSLLPSVSAADPTAEFRVCQDMDYQELDLAVDPFCNPRFGLSGDALSLDSDKVLDYMINNGYIDEDSGEPKADTDYSKYIENCMDRSVSIGGYTEDNSSKGEECINGAHSGEEEKKYDMFRVYFIDFSIDDGMENGYGSQGSGSQVTSATPEMCRTLAADDLGQIACKAYQFDNYGYKWGGGHGGTAKGFMTDFAAGKYTAGSDSILDCSGLVRMSIFDATGVDIGGMGTDSYPGYAKFTEVDKSQAKAGDILYKSGHTEIIVSNDPSKKIYTTFGAHTDKTTFAKQIGPSSYTYDNVLKVFRFAK